MSRPKLDPGVRRKVKLDFMMNDFEILSCKRSAKSEGKALRTWARLAVMDRANYHDSFLRENYKIKKEVSDAEGHD